MREHGQVTDRTKIEILIRVHIDEDIFSLLFSYLRRWDTGTSEH